MHQRCKITVLTNKRSQLINKNLRCRWTYKLDQVTIFSDGIYWFPAQHCDPFRIFIKGMISFGNLFPKVQIVRIPGSVARLQTIVFSYTQHGITNSTLPLFLFLLIMGSSLIMAFLRAIPKFGLALLIIKYRSNISSDVGINFWQLLCFGS